MGSILRCGPFAATNGLKGAEVICPITTNGDWVHTPEGQAELKQAVQSIMCAIDENALPSNTEIKWKNDDEVTVSIGFKNHIDAIFNGSAVKKKILDITKAMPTEVYRGIE